MKPSEQWQSQELLKPAPGLGASRLVVPGNPALLALARARRVLLLQGPVGPFFDRLTCWLRGRGTAVDRVVFQGGDLRDCRELTPIRFCGSLEQWPDECARLLDTLKPDCVVFFGQAREYHAQAMKLARARGVTNIVMEEGYFRPGYLTMELEGVNGYSTTLQRFVWQPLHVVSKDNPTPLTEVRLELPRSTEGQFKRMAWHAANHYWAMWRGRRQFPEYRHHKATSVPYYAFYWVRSWGRKYMHRWFDELRVRSVLQQPYYFVPLQHDGDAQISHHSPYRANTEFILQVMTSFARHAPKDTRLVFRQHPHARGGPGHVRLILSLSQELGIQNRVVHLVEGHTPSLVKHSLGVVVINSTVGLQALVHNRPLKVMGEALYQVDGLTFQGELHAFWSERQEPNPPIREHTLNQIKHLTQVPCNGYAFADELLRWKVGDGSRSDLPRQRL